MQLAGSFKKFGHGLSLWGLFVWIFIALLFPLAASTISVSQAAMVIFDMLIFASLGTLLLGNSMFFRVSDFASAGLSILVGGTVSFLLAPVSGMLVFYILGSLAVLACIWLRAFHMGFDLEEVFYLLPALVLLVNRSFVIQATSAVYVNLEGDGFYYNLLVKSLSYYLTINDCFYHYGVPINYQTLTFFFPAILSRLTSVNHAIVYNGIYTPFLSVFAFFFMAVIIGKVANLKKMAKGYTLFAFASLISLSLIIAAPLNPAGLLRMNPGSFLLLGEGYLLPTGSMGFAFSFICFGCVLFFFNSAKISVADGIWACIMLAIIAVLKLAFFAPALAFFFFVSLFKLIRSRDASFMYVTVISGILAIILIKLFWGHGGGLSKIEFGWFDGYYSGYFLEMAKKYGANFGNLGVVIFFVAGLLLWLGPKVILLLRGLIGSKYKEGGVRCLLWSSLLAIFVSCLPGWIFHVYLVNESGEIISDGSFDMAQFLRAAIFIFTVCTVAFLAQALLAERRNVRILLIAFLAGWYSISLVGFWSLQRKPAVFENTPWNQSVYNEQKKYSKLNYAMLSEKEFSGQVLGAMGVGPWWTSTERGDGSGGYVCTLEPNYRNRLIKDFLHPDTPLRVKKEAVSKMKLEKVQVMVATPYTKAWMVEMEKQGYLYQINGDNWLYFLK